MNISITIEKEPLLFWEDKEDPDKCLLASRLNSHLPQGFKARVFPSNTFIINEKGKIVTKSRNSKAVKGFIAAACQCNEDKLHYPYVMEFVFKCPL